MAQFFTPPVTGLRGSYFGDSGGATSRYYWVQAVYAVGRSVLAGPFLVTTPAGLSSRNVVLLTWNAMPGAIAYNVFKTATSSAPTQGTIALPDGQNITANSYTDMGGSDSLSSGAIIVEGLSGLGVARARYSFAVDGGAISTITPAAPYNTLIPSGAILIGGTVFVKAAVTSSGTTGLSVGTDAGSSVASILASTVKGSLTIGALINAVPVFATPVQLTAAGNITFTIITTALTAGIVEVFVLYYVPIN